MEADIKSTHRHALFDRREHRRQLLGDPHPAALQTHQHNTLAAVVALDDLVGDPGECSTYVVGAQDLAPARISRHVFLPRIGLTGPISRSVAMLPAPVQTL